MKLKKRHVILFVLVPIAVVIAFLGLRSFIFSKIESRVAEKLASLKASGLDVRYSSLSFQWGINVIELRDLLVATNAYDTTCLYPEFISVKKIRGTGFRLLPLLLRNVLSFEAFTLDKPRVIVRTNTHLKLPSSSKREKDFTLRIDRMHINAAEFTYRDNASCQVKTGISSDVTIDGLTLDFLADSPLAYQADWLSLEGTKIDMPGALYTFDIQRTQMDFLNHVLRMDSAVISPLAGKLDFGRKHGFEIDRYEGLVPFLECTRFSFALGDSSMFSSGMVEVQFYLKIFRDKHQPFRAVKKRLPKDQLAALPFGVSIDSLKIRKSYVQYEEFTEGAADPGAVYFDNLYASLYNINNAKTGATKLQAQADLQGKGRINIAVTIPLAPGKRATLDGMLTDFEMPELNSILVPATNIKIESGHMEKLSFNFSFDKVRSDGTLELQYNNLKLAIFKDDEKQDGERAEKDNFKTFMMNTFIFRTDMDEDVPEEKRTGTIGYLRDDNRSVFNFWIKSVVSGVKSAYNLDKTAAKKSEKEIKREQRLTRREARKKRRAERKRARG